MNPNQQMYSMWNAPHLSRNVTPDPVDELLSQFLLDVPAFLNPTPPYPYVTSLSASASAPAPAPTPTPDPITCCWVTQNDHPYLCNASLSHDPREAREHFRLAHGIRGNDKVMIPCLWSDCCAPPMQRGSVIRHILAVHLRLLRWQCGVCGKVFARKGTGHLCDGGVGFGRMFV